MEAGLVQILEGALLAAGEPLSVQRMALLFEENERPSKEDMEARRAEMQKRLAAKVESGDISQAEADDIREDFAVELDWRALLSGPRPVPLRLS